MDRLTPRPKIIAGLLAALITWAALQAGLEVPDGLEEALTPLAFFVAAYLKREPSLRAQLEAAGALRGDDVEHEEQDVGEPT